MKSLKARHLKQGPELLSILSKNKRARGERSGPAANAAGPALCTAAALRRYAVPMGDVAPARTNYFPTPTLSYVSLHRYTATECTPLAECRAAQLQQLGVDTDTVQLTVKTLQSGLATGEFTSPSNSRGHRTSASSPPLDPL
eukprot:1194846-Prorocentrum_minimum.AAC.4